jgi:flagellar hook protein FlgE
MPEMQKLFVWNGKKALMMVKYAVRISIFTGKSFACLFGLLACVTAAGQSTPPGVFEPTGVQSDLAISGSGYFVLRDPQSGLTLFTRQGEFEIDVNGYFVNGVGMRVQGYSDASLAQIGDVQIGFSAPYSIETYLIQSNGEIIAGLSDGSEMLCGQILLQTFAAPSQLKPFPYGMFTATAAAGPLPQPLAPGSGGLGTLLSGEIESPLPQLVLARIDPPSSGSAPITNQGVLIEGGGYFIVRDTNSNTFYATRAGACYLDANGHLLNYAGMRVQGYSNPDLSTQGDVSINLTGTGSSPGAQMTWYYFDWTGRIFAEASDGTSYLRGQILLQDCTHPGLLVRTNFGLYPMNPAAGPWSVLTAATIPSQVQIFSGWVELNQFDQNILNVRQRLNIFYPSPIVSTTNQDDLAIMGNGFFTLRDPVNDTFYATLHGHFHLDSGAWLVDSNGFRVQGFSDVSLTNAGDIRIDTNGTPKTASAGATLWSYVIGTDGVIDVNLSDGTSFERGQILLQNYADLQSLVPVTTLLYSNVAAAQPMYSPGWDCHRWPGHHSVGRFE